MTQSPRIGKAGIDTSKLTIYATDIGASDAPAGRGKTRYSKNDHRGRFRPVQQAPIHVREPAKLEGGTCDDQVPANLNSNRDEILQNTFTRGLPEEDTSEVGLGASGLTDPDCVPEPSDHPVTRLGDVWLVGDHRVGCGD